MPDLAYADVSDLVGAPGRRDLARDPQSLPAAVVQGLLSLDDEDVDTIDAHAWGQRPEEAAHRLV